MANQGSTPGDGKTNPFGNGDGKGAGSVASGNDFVTNPGGQSGGTKPPSFVEPDPRKKTQPAGAPEGGQGTVGGTAADDVTPREDAGNPIGAGSLGSGQKPFKLGG